MKDWISTRTAVPDDDSTVLIHSLESDDPVWLGFKDGNVWRNLWGEALTVTHWMPLPNPPAPGRKRARSNSDRHFC